MNEQLAFRLLIDYIPNEVVRQQTLTYLATLFPHVPRDKIAKQLETLPFYLSREPLTVNKVKPMVERLQQIGVGIKVVVIRDGVESVMAPATPPTAAPAAAPPPPSKGETLHQAVKNILHTKKKYEERKRPAQAESTESTKSAEGTANSPTAVRSMLAKLRKIRVGTLLKRPRSQPQTPAEHQLLSPEPPSAVAAIKPRRGTSASTSASGWRERWQHLAPVPRRLLLLLPLLLLLAGGGLFYWLLSPLAPGEGEWAEEGDLAPHAGSALAERLSRQWQQSYRPGPDQRFVEAYRLVASSGLERPISVEVTPFDRDWRIVLGSERSFILPNFADFETHWRQLLTLYQPPQSEAESDEAILATIRPVVGMFWAPTQLEALQQLYALPESQRHGPSYYQLVAEVMLHLALQSNPDSTLSDPLYAQALYYTLAAEVAGAEVNSLKGLLAWILGYQQAASHIGQQLPSEELLHPLLSGDRDRFIREAGQREGALRTRYLALQLIAERGLDPSLLEVAATRLFSRTLYRPAIQRLLLPLSSSQARSTTAQALIAEILAEMKHTAEGKSGGGVELSGRAIADFERLAARIAPSGGGREADAVALLYWKQAFWGGIAAHAEALPESPEQALAWITSLGGETPLAREFRDYLRLALPAAQQPDGDPLLTLARLEVLPWDLHLQRLRRIQEINGGREILRHLTQRGDHRPNQLLPFGILMEQLLHDPNRAEALFHQALQVAPEQYQLLLPQKLRLQGNSPQLRALVHDASQPLRLRDLAFQQLEVMQAVESRDGAALYRDLLEGRPGDSPRYPQAITFFLRQNDLESAATYLQQWQQQLPAGAAQQAQALAFQAEIARRRGDAATAWALVSEASSDSFALQAERARSAFALGEYLTALQLALESYAAHTTLDALLLALDLFWQTGQHEAVADLLVGHSIALDETAWREQLAPLFAQHLASNVEQLNQAVSALLSRPLPPQQLAHFAAAAVRHGTPGAPLLPLFERVAVNEPFGIEAQIWGYHALASSQNPAAARDWLQQRIPSERHAELPEPFYQSGEDDLLWEFFTSPPAELEARLWRLRAAAMVRSGGQTPSARRDQIVNHYRKQRGRSSDILLGRYLSDQLPEAQLIRAFDQPTEVARAAYYIARKNAQEQRVGEAAKWMQIALESGSSDLPEVRWAAQWLQERYSPAP